MIESAVVALGNRLRQDDGVGPVVLDRLSERRLPSNVLPLWMEHDPGGLCLLDPELTMVIIVDALAMDAEPGSVIYLPLTELAYHPSLSSHQLSPLELVPIELRHRTRVLGIVPALLGYGLELSSAVAIAADRAADYLHRWSWEVAGAARLEENRRIAEGNSYLSPMIYDMTWEGVIHHGKPRPLGVDPDPLSGFGDLRTESATRDR